MITEDYVSFEIAKLLKEKGFDTECDYLYVNGKLVRAQGFACNWNNGETLFTDYKNECSAPTLQMAMKWLREVHKIYISISHRLSHNADNDICFSFWINEGETTDGEWLSYEEACENAIRYVLENLI